MQPGFDFIGVGVGVACHDGMGQVCLNLRSAQARDEQGRWDLCGGQVEFGESPEQTVAREVLEEYGCAIEDVQFCGLHNTLRTIDGQSSHWLMLLYLARIDHNLAYNAEPDKHERIAWYAPIQIPKNRHSQFDNDWAIIKPFWDKYYLQKSA